MRGRVAAMKIGHRPLIVLGAAVSAVFMAAGAPGAGSPDTQPVELAAAVEGTPAQAAFLARWEPEIKATGELMHDIGVCERWMKKADVDHMLKEFAAPVSENDDEFQRGTQRLYTSLYVEGRAAASKFNLDATQCQRLLNESQEGVLAARKKREATERSISAWPQ